MPLATTYPGVYVEEIPSGVRTITGVSTSVAAFIDYFARGPMNRAVRVFSMGDFEREFGGLDADSEASYGVQQFFLNGGSEAWIVRVASGDPRAARLRIQGANGPTLDVEAIHPGTWGNRLRVIIDHPTPEGETPGPLVFNMTVALVEERDGEFAVVRSEVFRNLSMDEHDVRFVDAVVNDNLSGSKLVRVDAMGTDLPPAMGTLSGALGESLLLTAEQPQIEVTVTVGAVDVSAVARLAKPPGDLAEARALLEAAIRAARPDLRAFSQASVSIDLTREQGAETRRLRVVAGPSAPDARISFAAGGEDPTLDRLGLRTAERFQGVLSGSITQFPQGNWKLSVTIGEEPLEIELADAAAEIDVVRAALEAAIRQALPEDTGYNNARVLVHFADDGAHLLVLAGAPGLAVSFGGDAENGGAVDLLGLGSGDAQDVEALVSDLLSPDMEISAGSAISVALVTDDDNDNSDINRPRIAQLRTDANIDTVAAQLQEAIREIAEGAIVALHDNGENGHCLALIPPPDIDRLVVSPAPADLTSVQALGLEEPSLLNVREYALGVGIVQDAAQGDILNPQGTDGSPPNAGAVIGVSSDKTGLYALEDADLFNLLCVPRVAQQDFPAEQRAAVIAAVTRYCEERRAFFLMDTPEGVDEVQEAQDWLEANAALRSKNAALYFPRVLIPDPLNGFRLRSMGASGTVAGLCARTDATRGVWKAPAGTEATLVNVQRLDYALTDRENGALNPLGINCLRTLPIYGNVAWGARTLVGADQMASEWKYLPVRRLALFLEESLYRGTKWVVFEPNDEPLWAQIRLNLGAFMHTLFSQGAFQGRSPREAYLVKCDSETTTQNDIDLGRVNIVVGFAPLKPAEFVILKIQQLAGAIQT